MRTTILLSNDTQLIRLNCFGELASIKMSRTILVTGATGKQGGALIQSLLDQDADFRILALTRNSSSPSAQRLAAKSSKISLIQGNLDDTEAVFAEAKKISPTIWGVFAVIVSKDTQSIPDSPCLFIK